MKPMNVPWLISGVNVTLRQPRARPSSLGLRIGRFGVSDLGGLAVLHQGEGWHLLPMQRESGFQGVVGFWARWREGHQVNDVVDDAIDRSRESADQPVGAGRDGLEYRLHIVRRTGDHLQDVGCRGLPLQRLLVSLNSRAFSMAMTAWSAKVDTNSICFCVKGSGTILATKITPKLLARGYNSPVTVGSANLEAQRFLTASD